MIKAVIFDLDDTLYNEKDFVLNGFRTVCQYLSIKYNINFDEMFYNCVETLEQQGRGKVFNELCKYYNLTEDISLLVDIYRNAKPKISLYEDSIYVLNKLSKVYKLGLITDGMAKVQWNKIKALGIEMYFDKIIVTDDFGRDYWKPHRFAYDVMLKCFSCISKEAIYVGDNPNKDFIGAREVGLKTIRIIREHGDHMNTKLSDKYEADYVIKDLREVVNYLVEII